MYDTIEFEVKSSRIPVKQPKRRLYMPIKRADVFGDKTTKRKRVRSAEQRHAIKEQFDAYAD
jgi:hypothetical protein